MLSTCRCCYWRYSAVLRYTTPRAPARLPHEGHPYTLVHQEPPQQARAEAQALISELRSMLTQPTCAALLTNTCRSTMDVRSARHGGHCGAAVSLDERIVPCIRNFFRWRRQPGRRDMAKTIVSLQAHWSLTTDKTREYASECQGINHQACSVHRCAA